MDQTEQQLRLTVEALRERQEREMVTNPEFGLLHNVVPVQRLSAGAGNPSPEDLDELLAKRRRSHFFLAHPLAIAAFGRECTRRGVYPRPVRLHGAVVQAWRGVPLLPCDKLPVSPAGLTTILVMRTGERRQGVVGLRRGGLPEECAPGISVRRTGVDRRGLIGYLASAYYSVAVLVPDALGALAEVDVRSRL